jgi:hypothetical protein
VMQAEGAGRPPMPSQPARTWLLWLGLLVPLGAWMIQLFALYMLEDFISCTPGSRTPGFILGIGIRPIALGITLLLGLATIATGLSSLAIWRKMRSPSDNDHISAQGWMALAGIMNSVLFALIIFIKAAPPLILSVCQNSL